MTTTPTARESFLQETSESALRRDLGDVARRRASPGVPLHIEHAALSSRVAQETAINEPKSVEVAPRDDAYAYNAEDFEPPPPMQASTPPCQVEKIDEDEGIPLVAILMVLAVGSLVVMSCSRPNCGL
jgi:hypothetical protein